MVTVQFNKASNRFNVVLSGVILGWYTQAAPAYAEAARLNQQRGV